MANEIQTLLDAWAAATITVDSLGTAAGRISDVIPNTNKREAAKILVECSFGTGPTAGTVVEVYLVQGDGTDLEDNASRTDAAYTPKNATLLGTLVSNGTTDIQKIFDTKALGIVLGTEFSIGIYNATNQDFDANENRVRYAMYLPEVQ